MDSDDNLPMESRLDEELTKMTSFNTNIVNLLLGTLAEKIYLELEFLVQVGSNEDVLEYISMKLDYLSEFKRKILSDF